MNKITNTHLEQIDTICELQLEHLKRIKDKLRQDLYEVMCTYMEIIQEIVRKVKSS